MRKSILFFALYLCGLTLKSQSLTINPNPFAQRSQVCYTLTSTDTVTIVIYNRWGQEVLTLVTNSITPPGVYCDSLIMDNFEDNIYLLAFKNKQKNFTNKQVIKSATTSVRQIINDITINIYPNPVKDFLKIEVNAETEEIELSIINYLGQSVYNTEIFYQRKEIDIASLPSGIYFLRLQKGSGNKTQRFIKQ